MGDNKLFLILFLLLSSCCLDTAKYSEIEKKLISSDFENVWNLNPIFSLEEALVHASKNANNVLVLFTGLSSSGNPRLIWELLNSVEVSKLIKENEYIFCPLFTDVPIKLNSTDSLSLRKRNTFLQEEYINSRGTNWFQIIEPNGQKCADKVSIMSMSQQQKLIDFLKNNCS